MKPQLTVTLNLNAQQRDVLATAVKGKNFNVFSRNNSVEVNNDNVLEVRETVVQLFRTKFKQKTKTAQTMAICFACERIIDKIDNVLDVFGYEAPEEPVNDNEIGIVSISVPSLTKVEKVDAEATGDIQAFDKQELIDIIANKPDTEETEGE